MQDKKNLVENIINGSHPGDTLLHIKDINKEKQKKIIELDLVKEYQYFIIGDLHADLVSFKAILTKIDYVNNFEKIKLIFLGDFLDRGKDIFDLIDMIIKLKSVLENKDTVNDYIILLKGNHELTIQDENGNNVSPMLGATPGAYFFNTLEHFITHDKKQRDKAIELSENYKLLFDNMSIALIATDKESDFKFLAVHGGLPRADLRRKNFYGEDKNLMKLLDSKDAIGNEQSYNMLWSDPEENEELKYFRNDSNIRFKFNIEHFKHFCKTFDIDMIFRAHEAQNDGYKRYYEDRLMSVFSTGGRNKEDEAVVNPNSHYSKVSPNIFEIDLKKKIIRSYNIDFNDKKIDAFDIECATQFEDIQLSRKQQEETLKDFKPVEYKDIIADPISPKVISIIDNNNLNSSPYQIILIEEETIYELGYAELKEFYGVPTDFVFIFDKENKTFNISSKIIEDEKSLLFESQAIRLKNGLSINIKLK